MRQQYNSIYRGADSKTLQVKRVPLIVFLKGSKKKERLQQKNPELYTYFNTEWDSLGYLHSINNFSCRSKQRCSHPLCQSGKEAWMEWYSVGGPRVDKLLQIPWGSKDCWKCSGFCAGLLGHYHSLCNHLQPYSKFFFRGSIGSEPGGYGAKYVLMMPSKWETISHLSEGGEAGHIAHK